MRFIIGIVIMLSLSCRTEYSEEKAPYEFAEPPETVEVEQAGYTYIVSWKRSKGTDVIGYIIYWNEFKHDGLSWVTDGNPRSLDVHNRRQWEFKVTEGRYFYVYLKAYDYRGNKSKSSEVKYLPKMPPGYEPYPNMTPLIEDPWHGHLYKTGEDIELSWDEPESGPADGYEVKVELVNDEAHVATHIYPETSELRQDLARPHGFVGLCEFFIRARHGSEWSSWITGDSNDGQVKIGDNWVNTNWRLYWMLDAPVWN